MKFNIALSALVFSALGGALTIPRDALNALAVPNEDHLLAKRGKTIREVSDVEKRGKTTRSVRNSSHCPFVLFMILITPGGPRASRQDHQIGRGSLASARKGKNSAAVPGKPSLMKADHS